MLKANLNTTIAVCVFLAVLAGPAAAMTHYVDPNGFKDFMTIQEAIYAALDYDEIEVAPGTYYEDIDFDGRAVKLYSRDGQDVTTIDGSSAFHVVQCISGEGPDTILEGFTITGGWAFDDGGGGMYNYYSSPTVNDCNFTYNVSDSDGGGMYNEGGSPTVTNCKFYDNFAGMMGGGNGGGMYNNGSSPTVTNCTFSLNTAGCYGGGMCNSSSSPTVTNCTFIWNSHMPPEGPAGGGGMANLNNSSPTVANCTFTNNDGFPGGGMFNHSSSPTVTNCTFTENDAFEGGGMFNDGGSLTVTNCTFSGNSATTGGAMRNYNSSPTVVNCTFVDNSAVSGGGMFNNASSNPTVTNCTFTRNEATTDGGGMYNGASSPTVTNCILWADTPDEIVDNSSTSTVSYSDVQGGWPGAGVYNIDADPIFVDPSGRDLRLCWSSQCIDAGDNSAPALPATDLAGNDRVMDGDGDGYSVADMGVYEREAKVLSTSLRVNITPEEAVDAGAKWRIDSNDPWLDSNDVLYDLAPGYYEVEFSELPDWSEPEKLLAGYDTVDSNEVPQQSLWVRVIGDMNATATAEYKPVPVFAIGEIPPRDAPHGRRLEFGVDANWLGDDVLFSLTTTFDTNYPEPEGPILIDPCSGLFTYEPNDANDRTAFAVTFRAQSGADVNEQSVEITPIPDLPLEYEILSRPVTELPLPDPCDYIFVNEIDSDDPQTLNGILHEAVLSVTIGGKLIEVADVCDNLVYVYSDNYDINDLTIYAETVVISDPLNLPQTNVTIYARDLIFQGSAADINTTPIDPCVCGPMDNRDGLQGGDISLYIESYDPGPGGHRRFITSGTAECNVGRPGYAGAITCTLDTQQPLAWLSPYSLKMVIAHARDAYLYRYTSETHDILSEYEGLLNTYRALPEWNDLDEQWEFEFEQMHREIITLLHRIDNGLDYFGNPPNWVPALSFEVLYTVYEQEIERAMRVMYLSYWLQNKEKEITEKETALLNGRKQLWLDTEQARDDYNTLIDENIIGSLKARANSIADRIGTADVECYGLLCELKNKEVELLERAKRNVHEANKVPWWKIAGRALSTIGTSVITGAGAGSVAGPKGAAAGAVAGGVVGTISVLTDDSIMNPNPWPQASLRTDVARQFNSIDFDEATEGWIDDFNDIKEGDIEANGVEVYLQTLQASAADMADGLWGVKEALKTTLLDNEEVETALMKIKALDPTFNRLVDDVTELMVEKQLFNLQVAAAMQKVATLSNSMTNNVLAIDALNRDASNLNRIVDPRVNMYVKDMERRAMARLRKYHYYMAKAYEYRLLEPYPNDLNIDDMIQMMITYALTDPNGTLSSDDFSALQAVYEEQLSTLAENILDGFFMGGHVELNDGKTYHCSEEEITQLNAGEPLTLNLVEEGLFDPYYGVENIRIVDMGVYDINVVVTGDCGSHGRVVLTMYHPSVSKIQWKENIYLFRHLEPDTKKPLEKQWKATYDTGLDVLSHVRPSASSQSLLWTLLGLFGEATEENALIYARPGVWADIVIKKTEEKQYDCQMDIEDLWFEVKYDHYNKLDDLQTLRVATEPNIPPGVSTYELLPYFLVDTADESGRHDGIGDFYRIYDWWLTPDVNVTAPKTYGNWRFEKWVDKFDDTLGYDLRLNVSFTYDPYGRDDQTVYARYEYDGPIWAGDIDGDLNVDFRDFSALAAAWLTESGDEGWDEYCDISSPVDYVIDEFDLKVLCDDWLSGVGD